jgi:hypothetical protein
MAAAASLFWVFCMVSNRYVTFLTDMQNTLNIQFGVNHFFECFTYYNSDLAPFLQCMLCSSCCDFFVSCLECLNFEHVQMLPGLRSSYDSEGVPKPEFSMRMVNYIPYFSPHNTPQVTRFTL